MRPDPSRQGQESALARPTERRLSKLQSIQSSIKTRLIVALDQFLGWPPIIQIPAISLLTIALIAFWGWVWSSWAPNMSFNEGLWQSLTHFMDGGTLASDREKSRAARIVAIAVTTTGVLVLAFLTGAFASKLSERIDDLRSGRNAVIAKNHILILGFDSKVPLIVRELTAARLEIEVVILAQEEKTRLDAVLRAARKMRKGCVRVTTRTGDPRSELALSRVCVERARTILLIPPAKLDDDHAARWAVSTMLAVRHAVGESFKGRIVVESRRAIHGSLIMLTGEAGVAGGSELPIEVFSSDDIVARVLAQSIRQAGVYFALRELLSFQGSELYLERVPETLIGKTFDDAHSAVDHGIVVGWMDSNGGHQFSPQSCDPRPIAAEDRLIVLEPGRGRLRLAEPLPGPKVCGVAAPALRTDPQTILVIGSNRTLARLIVEIDRILTKGSRLLVSCPSITQYDEVGLGEAVAECRNVEVERVRQDLSKVGRSEDPRLFLADGVIILGCEDEEDPAGDASALALLLHLRHSTRARGHKIKRLITEVRDPGAALQISGSKDDFLVSNDVVAMVLAQVLVEPALANAYRELLDPTGVEVYLAPCALYVADEQATFGDVMAAARNRGEVAIGLFPAPESANGANKPILLNPPRALLVPAGPEASVVLLARPPAEGGWHVHFSG